MIHGFSHGTFSDRVAVRQGVLEIGLTEEPDGATTSAIQIDGAPTTWALSEDRYTLKATSPLAAGSHTLSIGTSFSDLDGKVIIDAYNTTFNLLNQDARAVFEAPNPRETPASTIGNTFSFQGLPKDLETGLLYVRNRYYDPVLGRFITTDPLGYVDGPNVYGFAVNDPVNGSDPLGLQQKRLSPARQIDLIQRRRELERQQREAEDDTLLGSAAKAVWEWFKRPFVGTAESAGETGRSGRELDTGIIAGGGNRDPGVDAALAEDDSRLPQQLHQQDLGELRENTKKAGEVARHAGETGGHALEAADRVAIVKGAAGVAISGIARKAPGIKGPSGMVSTKKFLENRWDKGTFPSAEKSAEYHLKKHVKRRGLNLDAVQYTQHAVRAFKDPDAVHKNIKEASGRKLVEVRSELGSGLFTPQGKIIWFHPNL